jgi:hypothetical protein
MQPMTAVTLFRLRWILDGQDGFEAKHRDLLRDLWPKFDSHFPEADLSREGQVMLFRIGYGRGIEFGTYRKAVEDSLLR